MQINFIFQAIITYAKKENRAVSMRKLTETSQVLYWFGVASTACYLHRHVFNFPTLLLRRIQCHHCLHYFDYSCFNAYLLYFRRQGTRSILAFYFLFLLSFADSCLANSWAHSSLHLE